ncbi:MAG TPA: PQQ-binding-like beta-propeller repeat protein, partial [Candidatus Sulfotelmatobacter sp.]|nr:PQQ-binding-like beta-propeller repeat protein [Candidatus Sulfotelmatobacter sp.]
ACGNAADNVQVAAVWYRLNHAEWTLATGTIVWTASDLVLTPGTNVLSACAVDLDGNRSLTNAVSFVYVPSDLLAVQVVGPGTVTPNYGSQLLPIGKKVTLTAKAAAGAQFVGWSGNWTTKQAALGFTMASNLVITATFVDVRRPVNVITCPAVNRRYTNEILQAAGKAADNFGVAAVWYQLNSNGWDQATTTNHWTNWTTGPLPLRLGTNLLQAVAEDAAHNLSLFHTVRFVKSATTLARPGSRRWALPTPGEIMSSATLGPDGVVYFGNNAKRLYALNGATGAKCWEIATWGSIDSAPALGPDGTLYVGTGGGRLCALDSATGSEKWHFDTGEWISSSPSVSLDGTVYCGCANNMLFAVDAATGTPKWSFSAPHEVYSSPALGGNGTIYFGAGTLVYALEGATGAKRWEFQADSYVWASPALGCDGTVYLGSEGGTFYALDGATGQVKWSFTTGARIDSSPALGADSTVYFGCDTGKLFALDSSTGAKKWEFVTKTKRPLASSPAIGADGVVYIGSWDGNLYAVDGTTGSKRWQFFIGGTIDASPAIALDGTVFIGSWNRWFYAINSDSPGLMESAWPKFKGGPLSTGRPGRCPQAAAKP